MLDLCHTKISRIVIYGGSGCGKTFFARKLSLILKLPLFCIDDYYWKAGWRHVTPRELINKLQPVLDQDRWILDGNYSELRPSALRRAQFAFILNFPVITCIFRLLIRTLARNLNIKLKNITPLPSQIKKTDVGPFNFFQAFIVLSKYSLKFKYTGFKNIYKEAVNVLGKEKVMVINNNRELKKFIVELTTQCSN